MNYDRSSAAVGTCKDGVSPFAFSVAQKVGDVDMAHFNNKDIFPFENLPAEIQNEIIRHAMTATDHQIEFPCLNNARYKPNVAVGLLLVNHRIYHEAHYQLREQNVFIFDNFGSDLKTISSSIGPLKCRSGACGYKPLRSSLANVMFRLGDDCMPDFGNNLVYAFRGALRNLRSEITINSLHLSLAYFSFGSSIQISDFASNLNKIKVLDRLTIMGNEEFLAMSIEDFCSSLGMKMKPWCSYSQRYNTNRTASPLPGCFHHQYVSENFVGIPQQENSTIDSTLHSEMDKLSWYPPKVNYF